jgi:hypothetical protein
MTSFGSTIRVVAAYRAQKFIVEDDMGLGDNMENLLWANLPSAG